MIRRLLVAPAPDDSDCRAIARRLVEDPGFKHRDEDPRRSEETYFGLARDTKHRKLPEAVLLGALEMGCKRGKRNRGASLIAEAERLMASLRKPAAGGGWQS
jgi:hypothetical protein